ncbi:MAG: hypothetical protein QM668_16880 [Agriterribacter sp.]
MRSRQIWFNLTLQVFISEPYRQRPMPELYFKNVTHAKKKVIIVGADRQACLPLCILLKMAFNPSF